MSNLDPESGPECTLRPAGHGDARLLFEWLNRPDRIAVSLVSKSGVSWEDHIEWFEARLADPNSRIFIIQCEDVPAGQIRFQYETEGHEISIYIEPEFRKSGVAYQAVCSAIDQIASHRGACDIIARVRTDNPRSRKFFEKLGFSLTATPDDHWILIRRVR